MAGIFEDHGIEAKTSPNSPTSLSLVSTRDNSTESLCDLGVHHSASPPQSTSVVSSTSGKKTSSLVSKRRVRGALLLAVVAVLASLWSRFCWRKARQTTKWGNGRLAMLVSSALVAGAKCIGVTAVNDVIGVKSANARAVEGRQVLACWHPHGLYVMAPLLFQSSGPRNRNSATYGFFTAVADACFKLPFFREVLMLVNARVADNRIIDALLSSGKSVYVCPGGIHEQLATDPTQERVFFPPNLGFVRQALKHGVPLVPTYNFGENQLYDVPQWSRAISAWLKERFGIGLPLGVGRWGLPFVPHKQRISIRIGQAVEVGEATVAPTEADVRRVFFAYCRELHRLFNEHKFADLHPDVAARGLELVWRGHESEDLSASNLLGESPTSEESASHSVAEVAACAGPEPVAAANVVVRSRL